MDDPRTTSEVGAETRARCTLEEHLSARQRGELDGGVLTAKGVSGTYYTVQYVPFERAVLVLESPRPWQTYVKGREHALPIGDLLLATLLMIQANEADWYARSRMCGKVWLLGS